MKISFPYLFFFLSILFSFSSCSEEDSPEEQTFQIFTKLTAFDEKESSQQLMFSTSSEWSIQTDQAWCTVTPSKGMPGNQTVNVTVEANEDYIERNASLVISSGVHQERLTVTQKQKNALLLTSSKQEMSEAGGTIEVEVKSNVNYSYSIDDSAVEWIVPVSSKSLETKTLKFRVKSNEELEKRVGNIYFFNETLRETFTVYQEGAEPQLVLTEDEYFVGSNGDDIKVELKSNLPYDIQLPKVDWIKEVKTRAMSTYTHYFSIAENTSYEDRNAEIIIKQQNSSLSKKIKINQAQKSDILIDKDNYIMDAKGGTLTLDLKTNVDFSVECTRPWIKYRASKSLQQKKLIFNIEENLTPQSREGTIVLKKDDIKKEIKVQQKAAPQSGIIVDTRPMFFGAKFEVQQLNFKVNSDWTALTKTAWTHVSPNKGEKGEKTINVEVQPINEVAQRTDTIYLQTKNETKRIPIIQRNQDSLLVLTPDMKVQGLRDTIIKVQVKSAYDVNYVIDDKSSDWIIPMKTRGLTVNELEFKLLRNNAVRERIGIITFINGAKNQKFTITQGGSGMVMTLSQDRFDFTSGEHDFDVTVTSNYKYYVWWPEATKEIDTLKTEKISSSEGFTTYKHYFHLQKNESINKGFINVYFINDEPEYEILKPEDKVITIFHDNSNVIKVPSTKYTLNSLGQTFDLKVFANVKYEVSVDKNWVKYTSKQTPSEGTAILHFDIEPNINVADRTTDILLKYKEWARKVTIIQKGFEDYGILVLPTDSLKEYPTTGGNQVLKFNASGDWTVHSDKSWCTLSGKSGKKGDNQLTVTVKSSADPNDRIAHLTFNSGKHTDVIQVVQKQLDQINFDHTKYNLPWNSTGLKIKFKGNCDYKVNVSQSWIKQVQQSKAYADDSVSFVFDKNMGDAARKAVISFSYLNKKQDISVIQNCMDSLQIVTPAATVSGKKDTTITIKLKSTSPVSYEISESAKSWIKLKSKPSRGLKDAEFSFTILKNSIVIDRHGTITFSNGNKKGVFNITQKGIGMKMDISPKLIQINTNKTKEFDITVKSNFKYRVAFVDKEGKVANWVTEQIQKDFVPSDENGFVTTKHHFIAKENESSDARELDILFINTEYIKEKGEIKTNKATVHQQGMNMIVLPDGKFEYSIPAKGQEISFKVLSNVDFKVKISEADAKWIKQLPDSKGLVNSLLRFKVSENKQEKRIGHITLSYPGCDQVISVVQDPFNDYGIKLTTDKLDFEKGTGSKKLQFDSSLEWVVESESDWCKVAPEQGPAGKGNSITVTVDENTETKSRTAKVLISTATKQAIVTVTQKQKDFLEKPKDQNVKWDQEELKVVVNTNCDYEVAYDKNDLIKSHSKDGHNLVFKLNKNPKITSRDVVVNLTFNELKTNFKIHQDAQPVYITPTPTSLTDIKWEGTEKDIQVKTNNSEYTVNAPTWIEAKKTQSGLHLKIAANDKAEIRKGEVKLFSKLSSGEVSAVIKVEQKAKSAVEIIGETSYEVSYEEGKLPIKVKAYGDFIVDTGKNKSWISEKSSRSTEGEVTTVTLDYTANTEATPRLATVTFTPKNGGKSVSLTVKQKASPYWMKIENKNKEISAEAQDVNLGVSSNCDYQVSIMQDHGWWLSLVKNNTRVYDPEPFIVHAGEKLIVHAAVNLTLDERKAHVKLILPNKEEQEILVTQKPGSPYIKVEKVTPEMPLEASEGEVTVTLDTNSDYTLDFGEGKSWLHEKERNKDKGTLVLKVDAFDLFEPEQRAATVMLTTTTGNKSAHFEVKQKGKNAQISVSPSSITTDWKEDKTKSATVKANGKYKIETSKWIAVTPNDGTAERITLQICENDEVIPRTGYVKLILNGKDVKITVTQGCKEIELAQTEGYKVGPTGGDLPITIKSTNCKYKVTSDVEWIKESSKQLIDGTSFTLHYDKNNVCEERFATITLTPEKGGQEVSFKVTQEAAKINIEPVKSQTIAWNAKSLTVNVKSNCVYKISRDADWLSVPETSQNNDGITFKVNDNPNVKPREAHVTLTSQKDSDVQQEFTITQNGKEAPHFNGEKSASAKAEGQDIIVKVGANYSYTVKVEEGKGWLTGVASQNGDLKLHADVNPSVKERTANVTLTSIVGETTVTETITVTQDGAAPSIEIVQSAPADSIEAAGASLTLKVKANCEYKGEIAKDSKWITDLKQSGSAEGVDTWTATVTENKDVKGRKGEITFKSTDDKVTKSVEVKQKAAVPAKPDSGSESETK